MGTVALSLVALVLGWLGTLLLARDVSRLQARDVSIAAAGALLIGLVLPRLGWEIWGQNGLRLPALAAMATAAVLTLTAANLLRGRGMRAGVLLSPQE